jgi:hypothetical protein
MGCCNNFGKEKQKQTSFRMKLPSIVSLMAVLSTGCIDTTPDPIVFCKDSAYPYWCEKAK